MKTLFFIVLLALTTARSASAKDLNKLNSRVSKNSATGLTRGSDYLATGSALINKQIEIPSNLDARVTAVGENAGVNQLPVQLKKSLSKILEGYDVKKATIFKGTEGDVFYVSAENEQEAVVVKIDEELNVSICKTTKQ